MEKKMEMKKNEFADLGDKVVDTIGKIVGKITKKS